LDCEFGVLVTLVDVENEFFGTKINFDKTLVSAGTKAGAESFKRREKVTFRCSSIEFVHEPNFGRAPWHCACRQLEPKLPQAYLK
jgi:hypothetical protein